MQQRREDTFWRLTHSTRFISYRCVIVLLEILQSTSITRTWLGQLCTLFLTYTVIPERTLYLEQGCQLCCSPGRWISHPRVVSIRVSAYVGALLGAS